VFQKDAVNNQKVCVLYLMNKARSEFNIFKVKGSSSPYTLNVCLRGARKPSQVSSFKTSILENCHPTYFSPCNSQVRVKEKLRYGTPQKILDEPNLQHNSLTTH
jgi:hypothetical protein